MSKKAITLLLEVRDRLTMRQDQSGDNKINQPEIELITQAIVELEYLGEVKP